MLTRLLQDPVALERPGLLMHVAARAAAAELALDHRTEAARHARQVHELLTRCAPFDIDRAEVWWIVADALRATDDPAAAADVIERGATWLRSTAQEGMPEAWRPGFLRGNPANRRLLAAAGTGRVPAPEGP